tara:strand:+ start:406 stop:582 length:177 start_codon:yes stop_codon:yes gene_type:complete
MGRLTTLDVGSSVSSGVSVVSCEDVCSGKEKKKKREEKRKRCTTTTQPETKQKERNKV